MTLVPINVRIPDENRELLESFVNAGEFGENATLSDAVREAVADYLRRHAPPQEARLLDGAVEVLVTYRGNAEIVGVKVL